MKPTTTTGQWLAAWMAEDGAVDRLPDGWDDPHALVQKIEAEARQDEPSPALREAVDQVESIAEFVEDHLDGFHTEPGEDDCRERLHDAVAVVVVAARALAANPPQTREAEDNSWSHALWSASR